jgi:hypothetical protein
VIPALRRLREQLPAKAPAVPKNTVPNHGGQARFIRNAEKAKKSPGANPEPSVEQNVRTKSKRSSMGTQASTMVLNPPQVVSLQSKGAKKRIHRCIATSLVSLLVSEFLGLLIAH